MVKSIELLRYSVELIRISFDKEELSKKLIVQTANLQDFASNLFKLCVLDFSNEVTFIEDRSKLLAKLSDESYCDGVYSVVSNGIITFYDYDDNSLLRLVLNSEYEDAEVVN